MPRNIGLTHGMHVHLNGQLLVQYLNTTLQLLPHVTSLQAFWDAKKMVTTYSQIKLKKFICQTTVVYR